MLQKKIFALWKSSFKTLSMMIMTVSCSYVTHWHCPPAFAFWKKRFVDVTIRYGVHPYTVDRWKKVLEIKADFEKKIKCSIYDLLPGAIENSL